MIIKEIVVEEIGKIQLSKGLNILPKGSVARIANAINNAIKLGTQFILCEEYLSCRVFSEETRTSFPVRLNRYLLYGNHFKPGEFEKKTDYLGSMKIFRSYLRKYINEFAPEVVDKKKSLWLVLDRDGVFHIKKRREGEYLNYYPSESERLLFEYWCFIKLNEFWEGACELRSLERPMLPLIINAEHLLDVKRNSQSRALFYTSPFQVIVVT